MSRYIRIDSFLFYGVEPVMSNPKGTESDKTVSLNQYVVEETIESTAIFQAELIPRTAIMQLIEAYRQRWPLRDIPNNLAFLLDVLE